MINKEGVIRKAKNNIKFRDISEALTHTDDVVNLICALLFANSFTSIEIDHDNDQIIFMAGHEPNYLTPKIIYSKGSKKIDGEYKEKLEKTFLFIRALENQLSSATLEPPHLRRISIQEVCKSIGLNEAEFKTLLSNWVTD